jgi:hypothetical protein
MSNEVVFEGEDSADNTVGNIQIVPGAPTGMLAWLVKNKVVKNARHAELFLLGVAIVAVILGIFFFFHAVSPTLPKSPPEGQNVLGHV